MKIIVIATGDVCNNLKNRGVKVFLIACKDGLLAFHKLLIQSL